MTKTNNTNKSAADFFAQNDFARFFENLKKPAFDMKGFMDTQRKNIQALTQAQQLTFQGLQAIAQRQSELLSQIVEDNSTLAREIMAEGTPEEKLSRNAGAFKSLYERAIENLRELSDIVNKSGEEASGVINKRISATMNEIQSALEKAQEKSQEKSQKKAA